ncbi:MAG: hypothetical protein JXA99_02790 [Candidatus Lokiarchaeota archaeon]|nr:hypothetical protein [Candidatus Lokiarchaeota archaeon]
MDSQLKRHLKYYQYLEFVREKSLLLDDIQKDIFKLVIQNYDLDLTKNQISEEIEYIRSAMNRKLKKEDYVC